MTVIPLGRPSLERLDATYPHTPRAGSTCAYLVLLRVEIARFTQAGARGPDLGAASFGLAPASCLRRRIAALAATSLTTLTETTPT